MDVASLFLRTDLMLVAWEGRIEDHGDFLVARTPASPRFYFGNFVLFPAPPAPGDAARWIRVFREAFADQPGIDHVCLRWDGTDGEAGAIDDLVAAGFEIDRSVTLTTDHVADPPHLAADATIRCLETDADWDAARRLQIAIAREQYGIDGEAWQTAQMARYRRFVAEGRGLWLGAFIGDRLVADLGIFVGGALGRFQAVQTDAAFRGRGLCGTLVHHAARLAFDRLGARTLVMVADPSAPAARVYASVGFAGGERTVAAWRRGLADP